MCFPQRAFPFLLCWEHVGMLAPALCPFKAQMSCNSFSDVLLCVSQIFEVISLTARRTNLIASCVPMPMLLCHPLGDRDRSSLASPAPEPRSKSGTQEGPHPRMTKWTEELAVERGQATSLWRADTPGGVSTLPSSSDVARSEWLVWVRILLGPGVALLGFESSSATCWLRDPGPLPVSPPPLRLLD